jgi:Ca-activated chloride channel homolog
MMALLHFAEPGYLWLLLAVPAAVAWYWYRLRHYTVPMQMSTTAAFRKVKPGWKHYMRYALFGLRMLAVVLLILALARPQTNLNRQDISVEGIDIVLATDISSTMLAEDIRPNLLEAAK